MGLGHASHTLHLKVFRALLSKVFYNEMSNCIFFNNYKEPKSNGLSHAETTLYVCNDIFGPL